MPSTEPLKSEINPNDQPVLNISLKRQLHKVSIYRPSAPLLLSYPTRSLPLSSRAAAK